MPWTSPPDDPVSHPGDGQRVRTLGPVGHDHRPPFFVRAPGRRCSASIRVGRSLACPIRLYPENGEVRHGAPCRAFGGAYGHGRDHASRRPCGRRTLAGRARGAASPRLARQRISAARGDPGTTPPGKEGERPFFSPPACKTPARRPPPRARGRVPSPAARRRRASGSRRSSGRAGRPRRRGGRRGGKPRAPGRLPALRPRPRGSGGAGSSR